MTEWLETQVKVSRKIAKKRKLLTATTRESITRILRIKAWSLIMRSIVNSLRRIAIFGRRGVLTMKR